MYLAMNRFHIRRGDEQTFETLWRSRESYLAEVPGFRAFHLLKGPQTDDYTLYATHTTWVDEAAFEGWIRSEAFRQAHAQAGTNREIYLGPPQFEGFESVLEQ